MTSHGFHLLFFHASHPSDEELLACLDGELDGRSLARVRRHLDGCWTCRARRERFDRSIAAFVEMRLEDGARRTGFPPASTAMFVARLREVDAAAAAADAGTGAGAGARMRSAWRRWFKPRVVARRALWRGRLMLSQLTPARLAPLTVALLTIVFITLSIGREPRVSAQELLGRTAAAQDARLRPVQQPVVYQRLQVSRRQAGAASARGGARASATAGADAEAQEMRQTWEVWSDASNGRYRERVGAFAPIARRSGTDAAEPCRGSAAAAAEPVRELESILCANGMTTTRPLSAAVFREWRGRVTNATDAIQRSALDDGREAMVLRTSVADANPLRIQEAELVVRTEDWHPLVQRFVVQAAAGLMTYELRELAFEVVPLATVAPGFFEDAPAPELTRTEPVVPAVPPVSEADLIAAHVQALSALHRLGALLGEPIEVVRGSSRRIEVRGLASTDARKQEIAEAVSGIPLVTVDVHTIDEAVTAHRTRTRAAAPAEGAPAAESVPAAEAATVESGVVPAQPLLDAWLGGVVAPAGGAGAGAGAAAAAVTPGRGAALATEVVSLSREAMTHAWALERLARFTLALDHSSVRPSTRRTLETVALELTQALAQRLDTLDQRVTPIISPVLDAHDQAPAHEPSAADADEWPRNALRTFERVRAADEATRQLFTESDAGALDLASAARTLRTSTRAARALAQSLIDTLAQDASPDLAPQR
jgi:hypothetical protein